MGVRDTFTAEQKKKQDEAKRIEKDQGTGVGTK